MEKEEIQLTLIDKQILKSYSSMIEGLADYLGTGYEIVLHSLESLENSVINIVHGEHTGRVIGAPITNKALEMLSQLKKTGESSQTYFSFNKNGQPLKSTTIAIYGENNRIIGLLCFNFYMNTSFREILECFSDVNSPSPVVATSENFATSIEDTIDSTITAISSQIYADTSISQSNKNKAIIAALYDKGVFRIKDSVIEVAKTLGISKNTVYLHLRNCQEDN